MYLADTSEGPKGVRVIQASLLGLFRFSETPHGNSLLCSSLTSQEERSMIAEYNLSQSKQENEKL